MSLEQAVRAEAERRWPEYINPAPDTGVYSTEALKSCERGAFAAGTSWLSEYLLSEESVERAARAVHESIWPEETWDSMPEQYQRDIMAQERAALQAVLGKEQTDDD